MNLDDFLFHQIQGPHSVLQRLYVGTKHLGIPTHHYARIAHDSPAFPRPTTVPTVACDKTAVEINKRMMSALSTSSNDNHYDQDNY